MLNLLRYKSNSVECVDLSKIECIYSPAKRRGPVPGRAGARRQQSSQILKHSAMSQSGNTVGAVNGSVQTMEEIQLRQMLAMQNNAPTIVRGSGMGNNQPQQDAFFNHQRVSIQQQLSMLQQMQSQQTNALRRPHSAMGGNDALHNTCIPRNVEAPASRRMKFDHQNDSQHQQRKQQEQQQQHSMENNGVPKTIAAHTHLLELSDTDGSRLRAYYRLSVDEVFGFPPTPTDEEYCARLNIPGMTPRHIPGTHLAALSASRFAEVALGSLVHDETSLAMELCNAVVHCLKESVQETVQQTYMFEVARSYFLLAVFRSMRGDMMRYFKYRRVCLTYVSKLHDLVNATTLIAAISFVDAWAYMIYNADDKKVPQIDNCIPRVERCKQSITTTMVEMEYNVKCDPSFIASDPRNQNWIQGAPPVFLNNEAPLRSRSLDALSCAVRTCCDQANGRFCSIQNETKIDNLEKIPQESIITPTTTAVLAHENELCSRNMVLSAFTLLQQYETVTPNSHKNQGMHLIMSAMDAFLDNGDEDETGGFTDSQIQSLLSVANTVLENPLLLHHAGPTYHMVSNAAVMLCHLLNSLYMMKGGADRVRKEQKQGGGMEAAMFEEILDTFTAVRKLLIVHRRKLPIRLRCHSLPRPPLVLPEGSFIDLGETLLCACRGCQGFVLMACSPVVAAQKAQAAATKRSVEAAREAQVEATDDLDKELKILTQEFNKDDDALLNMLSVRIS